MCHGQLDICAIYSYRHPEIKISKVCCKNVKFCGLFISELPVAVNIFNIFCSQSTWERVGCSSMLDWWWVTSGTERYSRHGLTFSMVSLPEFLLRCSQLQSGNIPWEILKIILEVRWSFITICFCGCSILLSNDLLCLVYKVKQAST